MNQIIESLEPTTRSFVEKLNKQGGTPINELSPKDARKVLDDLQATTEVAKLPADIEDGYFCKKPQKGLVPASLK